jgi:hypothetical protein
MTPKEIEIDDKKLELKKIYDCLMFSQCMLQYTKYGNYVAIEQAIAQYDVRIGQQFAFYILFTIFTAFMTNRNQAYGVSFSRAVGIVFLMNELEQIFYCQELLESFGQDKVNNPNFRIDVIYSLFPATWCVFEKI